MNQRPLESIRVFLLTSTVFHCNLNELINILKFHLLARVTLTQWFIKYLIKALIFFLINTSPVSKKQGVFAYSVSPNAHEPFLNFCYVVQLILRYQEKNYIISTLLYEVETEGYKAEKLQFSLTGSRKHLGMWVNKLRICNRIIGAEPTQNRSLKVISLIFFTISQYLERITNQALFH